MRLALFYLILLVAQGALSALFAPLPAADLFLLVVLSLVFRIQAWQLVLVAYGVGLLQDLIGHGIFGLHAFGLAGAALAASLVRAQLSQKGLFARSLVLLVGWAGKWLALTPLIVWQTGMFKSLLGVAQVAPIELVFTLLLSFVVLPWGDALMDRTSFLQKELL